MTAESGDWCVSCPKCHPGRVAEPCGAVHNCPECAKQRHEAEAEAEAIDPPGCGCTDCLAGRSVPLECMTPILWKRWLLGQIIDRTSLTTIEVFNIYQKSAKRPRPPA